MEAPDHPHAHRTRSSTAITVAELLARQAGLAGVSVPAAVPDPAEPSRAISVAALLRREGCGPHCVDPPLVPRGHSRPVRQRRRIRKAPVVAGVLVAVGAVVGSALIDHAVRERAGSSHLEDVKDGTDGALQALGTSPDTSGNALGAASEPVDAVTLTSMALFIAEAVPMSTTGTLENTGAFAEPVLVGRLSRSDTAGGTVRPRFPTGGFATEAPGEVGAGSRPFAFRTTAAGDSEPGAHRAGSGAGSDAAPSHGRPHGATGPTGGSGTPAGGPPGARPGGRSGHEPGGHGHGRHGHGGQGHGGHGHGGQGHGGQGHGHGHDGPSGHTPSGGAGGRPGFGPGGPEAQPANETHAFTLALPDTAAAEIHVPSTTASRARVALSDAEIELPAVELPSTRIRGTGDDHEDDAGEETSEVNDVVDEVTGTVEDIAGTATGEDSDTEETSEPADDGERAESDAGEETEAGSRPFRSIGEAAARAIDEITGQG